MFERSKALLNEMLSDFPNAIKFLLFSKDYNVNSENTDKIKHLFPYRRFEYIVNFPDDLHS